MPAPHQTHQPLQTHYDVVIIGAGHNGLVATSYLAKAGLSVLVLERRDHVGGATRSEQVFAGVEARLSVYSYLVSLFPEKIKRDLGLKFEMLRRPVASFTPTIRAGSPSALLVSNVSREQTAESFRGLTGRDSEFAAWERFYSLTAQAAERIWPTLLEPLMTRAEMQRRFESPDAHEVWCNIIEQPLGEWIERHFQDDLVRGVVFTDAKIGVLTHPHDPTLLQNRTFLYHVIGNASGEWRVPAGGMGSLVAELERCARDAHAEILTGSPVERISVNPHEIAFRQGERQYTVGAKVLLVNTAPAELDRLMHGERREVPNGSVFKINMLLKRLPRLQVEGVSAEQAFAGTFHIDEGYTAMQASYASAAQGQLPAAPPSEIYCHTLTDPSILGPRLAGYHTLTLFGLDSPASCYQQDHEAVKQEYLARYVAGINRYLAEPLEECLALDANGRPCIEAKSPLDLEHELNMHGGNIFHTDLSWPFVESDEQAGQWGVETAWPNVYLCGSGALRGGAVSGIPGHNAAMKVLVAKGIRGI